MEKKQPNRRRSKQIVFWLSEEEVTKFNTKYKLSGFKSKSDFILECLNKKELTVIGGDVLDELRLIYAELKKQGVNLNQIAHIFNAELKGEITQDNLLNVVRACTVAYTAISEIVERFSMKGG
jgi:hypothetical protein